MAVALREHAEGIDESGVDERLESGTLLVGESLFAAIRLRIRKVELGVRHIEVAAENDRLGLFELLAIGKKRWIPMLEAQRDAAQVVLGIGRVHRHDVELGKFRGDDPSFIGAVALQFVGKREALREIAWKAVDDGQRLLLGKNRCSRIALFDRRIPVLAVIGQVDFDLPALSLGLLQTKDVGLVRLEERQKQPFLVHGTNAVDVPGINLHGDVLKGEVMMG